MNHSPAALGPPLQIQAARRDYRRALGQFATGVAIVTTCRDGQPAGLTVNAFTSASLDPPLVLWCLSLAAGSAPAFLAANRFAVNVLALQQVALARRFSTHRTERFAGVGWRVGPSGMPLLDGVIAHYVCRRIAHQIAGDHFVFVGEVEHYASDPGRPPLIFHGGEYGQLDRAARDDVDYSGSAPKMKVA